MSQPAPAIVVVGFNRPQSITRLLNTLSSARYDFTNTNLVLSIDHSNCDRGRNVRELCNEFNWRHGEKRLLIREQNLGLRAHMLQVGKLSQDYGSIIVLEDDLSVGPDFYKYACEALEFCEADERIAGVSLYDHRTNFLNLLPFQPVVDGYDNYYLQIAQSWGQAWTARQWQGFQSWYESLDQGQKNKIPPTTVIHPNVMNWPSSSWLKYFIGYLVETEKYFFYPRSAHSTNNSDSGTHVGKSSTLWQIPLAHSLGKSNLASLEQSLAIYDSFFDIRPDCLKRIAPELSDYEFCVDLWGYKPLEIINDQLVLTSRLSKRPIQKFDLARKPMEDNFRVNSEHTQPIFSLSNKAELVDQTQLDMKNRQVLEYFFGRLPLSQIARQLPRWIVQKIMST